MDVRSARKHEVYSRSLLCSPSLVSTPRLAPSASSDEDSPSPSPLLKSARYRISHYGPTHSTCARSPISRFLSEQICNSVSSQYLYSDFKNGPHLIQSRFQASRRGLWKRRVRCSES